MSRVEIVSDPPGPIYSIEVEKRKVEFFPGHWRVGARSYHYMPDEMPDFATLFPSTEKKKKDQAALDDLQWAWSLAGLLSLSGDEIMWDELRMLAWREKYSGIIGTGLTIGLPLIFGSALEVLLDTLLASGLAIYAIYWLWNTLPSILREWWKVSRKGYLERHLARAGLT